MIVRRRSEDRGRTRLHWLDGKHSFSFGDYLDPDHMGFSVLRVINEDVVEPGTGFGMHPHRDMEIVTYILDGALEHGDSLGNGSVIRPGDVQRMSAGTGIVHREWNPSDTERVHLLQIWLLPERAGITPGYEETNFDLDAPDGALKLIASRDGRDGSVTIHQDAEIRAGRLPDGTTATHRLAPGRSGWVQVARGAVTVNGEELDQGDGAAIRQEDEVAINARGEAEVLVFDLP